MKLLSFIYKYINININKYIYININKYIYININKYIYKYINKYFILHNLLKIKDFFGNDLSIIIIIFCLKAIIYLYINILIIIDIYSNIIKIILLIFLLLFLENDKINRLIFFLFCRKYIIRDKTLRQISIFKLIFYNNIYYNYRLDNYLYYININFAFEYLIVNEYNTYIILNEVSKLLNNGIFISKYNLVNYFELYNYKNIYFKPKIINLLNNIKTKTKTKNIKPLKYLLINLLSYSKINYSNKYLKYQEDIEDLIDYYEISPKYIRYINMSQNRLLFIRLVIYFTNKKK